MYTPLYNKHTHMYQLVTYVHTMPQTHTYQLVTPVCTNWSHTYTPCPKHTHTYVPLGHTHTHHVPNTHTYVPLGHTHTHHVPNTHTHTYHWVTHIHTMPQTHTHTYHWVLGVQSTHSWPQRVTWSALPHREGCLLSQDTPYTGSARPWAHPWGSGLVCCPLERGKERDKGRPLINA